MNGGVLKIEEGVICIAAESYINAELTELKLPSSLKTIGAGAFMECSHLRRVSFSGQSSLQVIEEGAFAACEALEEFVFPKEIKSIGEMAFTGTALPSVILSETIESVGEMAFWDCSALEEAVVLNPEAKLGKDAFGSCPKLKKGFLAPGFGEEETPGSVLYTVLLWCTCPGRYDDPFVQKAQSVFLNNIDQYLLLIVKEGRHEALKGILESGLKEVKKAIAAKVPEYIDLCKKDGKTRNLLMAFSGQDRDECSEDEFEI